ncbi:MAG: HEAT repeat domain-containing protein, partial [Dehalococcoidia bacterium]
AVFAAIAQGEAEMASERLAILSGLDAAGREQVADGLARLDPAARFAFLDRLLGAAEVSALLDFSAICRDCLHDPDVGVRALAVSGLSEDAGDDLVEPLVDLAQHDPDAGVRSEAALALGSFALRAEFGQLRASAQTVVVEGLRAIAQDAAEEPTVQASALASAGVISEAWVQDLIFDAYESDEPALRIGALQAMGRTVDDYWLPTLLNAMESADEDERIAAAHAAGEIGNEDALVALAELLEDENLDVVQAAALALGEIGGRVAAEHLEPYATHPHADVRAGVRSAIEQAAFADDPLGAGR